MRESRRRRQTGVTAILIALVLATACGRSPAPTGHPAPLILVSFDGFRWDYAGRTDTPALDRLAATGLRAERLIPVFPSKTFPGHYSIITGLYPGHHGIVSNNIRDPRWPEPFHTSDRSEVQNGRWWGGEPVWVTAARHGLRSGVYFWPGSEASIQGVQPHWWFAYDETVPWDARVDAALGWLSAPEPDRAAFVALYFEEPNDAGHRFGPDSPEVADAVHRVDGALGHLLDGLAARRIEANVLVVSDHGMAATDPSRVINLDDYVELFDDEVFEYGAIGQIFPRPGREDLIFTALEHAHPQLAVYRRGAIPEHLHLFDNPRTPPILLSPASGWEVVARGKQPMSGGAFIRGDHGYDPASPDVQGIFYASGPDIAYGGTLGAIEEVDLYALMCRLVGIDPAPNDGDWTRVAGVLKAR